MDSFKYLGFEIRSVGKKKDILGLIGSKEIEKLGFLNANTTPKIKVLLCNTLSKSNRFYASKIIDWGKKELKS